MKTSLLIIIICLSALAVQAQWSQRFSTQKHYLYSSGEYIAGEKQAVNIGLNYIFNNKYTVNLGYMATSKSTVLQGEDFMKSSTKLTSFSSAQPFQNTECLHLMVGRVLDLNKNGSIRIILQGGPGISASREPEFNLVESGNQYNFKTTTTKDFSIVLNPKVEMPLCCSIGCSVGPVVIVNGNETFIGAGIGLMYGIVKEQ